MGEDSEEAKGRGEKPLSGDSEGLARRELGERRARRPRGSEAAALEASARILPVQRHGKHHIKESYIISIPKVR